MAISALPPAPSTTDPTNFDTEADAFVAALSTFRTEANATAAGMTSVAAGGAMAIPYTFSTTTTDADPGAGFLRLSSATQNAATVIRADLAGADGSTWTDMLDTFDDSTSTIKGFIFLQSLTTPTSWLLFSVSALASPAGYKNLTVTNVASSAASPFANNESLVLKFTRTGDKGDTGSTAGVSNSAVVVHTGGGHGSTNTKVRIFTTTLINTGTAITFATSAANGASFTINEDGFYAVKYSESTNAANANAGVSLNSAALTTDIQSLSEATKLMCTELATGTQGVVVGSDVFRLVAGDVIRPHTNANAALTTGAGARFSIRKVAFTA